MKITTLHQQFLDISESKGCNRDIAHAYYAGNYSIDELINVCAKMGIDKQIIIKSIGVLYNLTLDHAQGVVERRIE